MAGFAVTRLPATGVLARRRDPFFRRDERTDLSAHAECGVGRVAEALGSSRVTDPTARDKFFGKVCSGAEPSAALTQRDGQFEGCALPGSSRQTSAAHVWHADFAPEMRTKVAHRGDSPFDEPGFIHDALQLRDALRNCPMRQRLRGSSRRS
jgi:hypothetical protein